MYDDLNQLKINIMKQLLAILAAKTPKEKLIEALRDSCQDYLDGKTNDTEKIRLESLIFSVHEASDGDIDKAMKLLHCNDEEMPEPGNQSDQEQG